MFELKNLNSFWQERYEASFQTGSTSAHQQQILQTYSSAALNTWHLPPWKKTSNLFLTGVNNHHKKVSFIIQRRVQNNFTACSNWTALVSFATAVVCQKAKVVPGQIWHTQFWVFMKSFADQFFLMSSSNLVLSVVQKLRSPYFTTAMQKRNARKILKVRSPHSSTVFASMMWSLPPRYGVVLL